VPVGPDEGLKHDSGVYCDELVSLPKTMLTHFVGMLPPAKLRLLDRHCLSHSSFRRLKEERTEGGPRSLSPWDCIMVATLVVFLREKITD